MVFERFLKGLGHFCSGRTRFPKEVSLVLDRSENSQKLMILEGIPKWPLFWTSNLRSQISDLRSQISDSDPGFGMFDLGCRMSDLGCRMSDVRSWMSDVRYLIWCVTCCITVLFVFARKTRILTRMFFVLFRFVLFLFCMWKVRTRIYLAINQWPLYI